VTEPQWQERLEELLAKYKPEHNVELFEELVTECTAISTWEEFEEWVSPFKDQGCFRGQGDATWSLITTLERKVWKRWIVETDSTTSEIVDKLKPEENERALLREFQRAAHHHYPRTPALDQTVDWLALMQHHGAPTRMLDWTRSPYVALYFAMQSDQGTEAALWAIDLKWLKERSNELLRRQEKNCPDVSDSDELDRYTNHILLRPDNDEIIVSASPKQLNERMLIQQGELLCNLRHGSAFSTILLGMLIHPSKVQRQVVSKIKVKKERRAEFIERLHRMNIHEASLFPGLDGFARSLGVRLDILVAQQVEDRKEAFMKYRRSKIKLVPESES